MWRVGTKFDVEGRQVADRHYNRRKVGSPQFVPPGRSFVLVGLDFKAVWTTSWPFPEYVRHRWAGAWINSIFRNESPKLSSSLILEAVAHTRFHWPDVPEAGLITFVNRSKVKPKRHFGYCYRMAGFKPCGETEGGLLALQLLPADMPDPAPAHGEQFDLIT